MLHKFRKRQEQLAEQEARGVNLWSEHFDQNARARIMYALRDSIDGWGNPGTVGALARGLILTQGGELYLVGAQFDQGEDFFQYLMGCDDGDMPTVIEAIVQVLYSPRVGARYARRFEVLVSTILREHRISFDLVNKEMVEFSSRELHVSVVRPALTLLADSGRWAKVEKAYQDALHEISNGNPGDAITDSGTALQELLTELGCEGNALGPLARSARRKGLLAAHDGPLVDAIERVLHWVSADRSELGDAHSATEAGVPDAWFTVHGARCRRIDFTSCFRRNEG